MTSGRSATCLNGSNTGTVRRPSAVH